jgi:hypothetical protein
MRVSRVLMSVGTWLRHDKTRPNLPRFGHGMISRSAVISRPVKTGETPPNEWDMAHV